MRNKATIIIGLFFLTFLFQGCAVLDKYYYPKITQKERSEIKAISTPFTGSALYDDALLSLGEYINSKVEYTKIIQPKRIGNTAGGEKIPFNLTNMVITSLDHMSGPRLVVTPYDPEFINNDAITGGAGSRIIPSLLINGSITEFDQDIDASEKDIDLDLLFGGGKTETDLGFGNTGSKKMSRITLDLCLLDYKTHSVIPGCCVTNTVNVMELEKGRKFGFAIYGSGMGISGRVSHTQGFHRSVRNLVNYSILQLMGKYYNLPYWRALGIQGPDPEVMNSLRKSFEAKPLRKQIKRLQKLLNQANIEEVVDPNTGNKIQKLAIDGVMGRKTKAYIEAFENKYVLDISKENLSEIYLKLIELETIPMDSVRYEKEISENNLTNSQRFFDKVDRVENVYQKPAIDE